MIKRLIGLLGIIALMLVHVIFLESERQGFYVGGEWFLYVTVLFFYISSMIKKYIGGRDEY